MPHLTQVEKALRRHKSLKTRKSNWNSLWQLCGEFVHGLKMDFNLTTKKGEMLNEDIYDSHAVKANRKMAGSLIGMLWQGAERSIKIVPTDDTKITPEIQKYFDNITLKVAKAMDDPRAGLMRSLDEYMQDQGAFGTCAVPVFKGEKSDLIYSTWGVQQIAISEGADGFIDTVYREIEMTARNIIEKYGRENVSERVTKLVDEGDEDEFLKVLQVIEPRLIRDLDKEDNKNMPWKSLHIEIQSKNLLRESGFDEMPVIVSRFFKRVQEVYGRSPGMESLPDNLHLQALGEALLEAVEKMLDPPLVILDDGKLGGTDIDTSAKALNVLRVNGRLGNQNPIQPLFTIGDMSPAQVNKLELRESIDDHFFIERLLDFNNQTQMTLGEAQIRDRKASESIGTLLTRQINEFFTPLIERSVNILFKNDKLGVVEGSAAHSLALQEESEPLIIPDEIATLILNNKVFYEIVYTTPAIRIIKADEAQGIAQAWEFAAQLAQVNPEVLDNLDADESIRIFSKNIGVPTSVIVSDNSVKTIRNARQKQLEERAKLEQAQGIADIKKTAAEGQ